MAGLICVANAAYIPAKAAAAQILMERAWDKSQDTGTPVKPWNWLDTQPIAKLRVPHLKKSAVVLDVTSGQALGFAPTHMAETARPGMPGLSALAAHKDTHFAFAEHLKIGDTLYLDMIDGQVLTYKVSHMTILNRKETGVPIIKEGHEQLALVTCYPFNAFSYGGDLRYIVYATRVYNAINHEGT